MKYGFDFQWRSHKVCVYCNVHDNKNHWPVAREPKNTTYTRKKAEMFVGEPEQ